MQHKHPRGILEIQMEIKPQYYLDLQNHQHAYIDSDDANSILSLTSVARAIATMATKMVLPSQMRKQRGKIGAGFDITSIGRGKQATSFSVIVSSDVADSAVADLLGVSTITVGGATAKLFASACHLHDAVSRYVTEFNAHPTIKILDNVDKFLVERATGENRIHVGSREVVKSMGYINDLRGARSGISLTIAGTLHDRGPWINLTKPAPLEEQVARIDFRGASHSSETGIVTGTIVMTGKERKAALRCAPSLIHEVRRAYGTCKSMVLDVQWYQPDEIYSMFAKQEVDGEIVGLQESSEAF